MPARVPEARSMTSMRLVRRWHKRVSSRFMAVQQPCCLMPHPRRALLLSAIPRHAAHDLGRLRCKAPVRAPASSRHHFTSYAAAGGRSRGGCCPRRSAPRPPGGNSSRELRWGRTPPSDSRRSLGNRRYRQFHPRIPGRTGVLLSSGILPSVSPPHVLNCRYGLEPVKLSSRRSWHVTSILAWWSI
jgi:hypothetical protein